MKITAAFVLVSIAFSMPAYAQEKAAPEKAAEVPFRQDAGLITAEYYLSTGKYTQALQVLGGVAQRHPQSADAFVYMGFAHEQLGDDAKALNNYQTALQIDPRHLGAHRYVGGMHLRQKDRAKAFESLQAIRLICAGMDCAEETELENLLNAAR